MSHIPLPFASSLFGLAMLAASACAPPTRHEPRDPGGQPGGNGGGSGGGAAGSGGAAGPGADGGGGPSGPGCSGDLRKVLSSGGAVLKECPPDQGCADAKCVPACEAAAASHGSLGCDFLLATPPHIQPCFAAFVANAWPLPVHIEVDRGGKSFTTTSFARVPDGTPEFTKWPALDAAGLPTDRGAVLFLATRDDKMCPVPHAVGAVTGSVWTGRGTAFHVHTDVPVALYDISPFGGATSYLPSAELDMPTTAWGKEYVAVIPPIQETGDLDPAAQIVAAEDGTTVSVTPTVDLPSGTGVISAPKGVTTTFTLGRGQLLQWMWHYPDDFDMTGTVITADKPIAFFGGAPGMVIHSADSAPRACCSDFGRQQIPTVSALGWDYVAAPYVTRRKDLAEESIVYRLVGVVDGTKLTFDPPVPGAPAKIDLGDKADFQARGPFRVSSQGNDNPFYLAQFMAGSNLTAGTRSKLGTNLGDPEQISLLPPQQFLDKYVFFTDPTYGNTSLVLTREKGPKGFADVTVDCLGKIAGWHPAGGDGHYEVTAVDLSRDWDNVGSCRDGVHVASSDAPFGLVVWGLDRDASYGYPAGGNAHKINSACVNRTAGCL